ncbi:helix-turn-helix domain-containing protein [Sorangium sp. KYC3313]|uniref:helix-turn-helix domain-containing protein n=1 Tax=Sorangium sp. KYC3313 TaxID=3449740 RepID=UPI003F8921E4
MLATLASNPQGPGAALVSFVVEIVQVAFREMQQAEQAEDDPVLDAEGAAALLGTSRETAIRLARKGEIAAMKLGPRLGWRFRRSDVLAYLEAKRRRPAPVAANDAEGLPTDAAGVLAEMNLPALRGRR